MHLRPTEPNPGLQITVPMSHDARSHRVANCCGDLDLLNTIHHITLTSQVGLCAMLCAMLYA